MDSVEFVYDNDLPRHSFELLYLNEMTADFLFVFKFDEDHVETLPAHKNLLSVGSSVFEAMFYGPIKEQGDIPVVDASVEAFKEFLQFFYLTKVRITSRNVGEVINLCNKYEMADGLVACEIPFQQSLTYNDMCWGYELATLLELENVQTYCEQKFKENAQQIITSDSFLECSRKTVMTILQLVNKRCPAMIVIESCIKWATEQIIRQNSHPSGANLREQLGELIDNIPFRELSVEEFSNCISKHRGIMRDDDINSIVDAISAKDCESNVYMNLPLASLPELNCDRRLPGECELYTFFSSCCWFEPNKDVLLTEFYLPRIQLNGHSKTLDVFYNIYEPNNRLNGDVIMFRRATLTADDETLVVLPRPLLIKANKTYLIHLCGTDFDELKDVSHYQLKQLKDFFEFDGVVKISFFIGSPLVSRMILHLPRI